MSKTFRGYSLKEVQYKKQKWLFNNFRQGLIFKIIREDIEPCIFFGNIKLIVEFI